MNIENRNLFRINRLILLHLPVVFRWFSFLRKPNKRLLLIKVDEIGDYILMRNYIEALRTSEKYTDYQIDLIGNIAWKDMAQTFDSNWLNDLLFINVNQLYDSPIKTWRLAWKLFKKKYEIVLQPTSSRTLICDSIAGFTAAPAIVGFLGDTERIYKKYKKKTDKFYTTTLALPPNILFEFERNRYFFEQAIETDISIVKPYFNFKNEFKSNNIVIFPGAGSVKRQWGENNFLEVIKLILENTTYTVTLAGGKSELHYGEYFFNHLPSSKRLVDKIAKTSLPELVDLIVASDCIITNETSSIHIAASCNTPAICIQGGGHYQRFTPYPINNGNNLHFIYERTPCFNCNWNCIYETKSNEPHPCVSINTVQQVWLAFIDLTKIL